MDMMVPPGMKVSPIFMPSGGVSLWEPKKTDGLRRMLSLMIASRTGCVRVQSKSELAKIGSTSSRSRWSHSGYRAKLTSRNVRAVAVVSLQSWNQYSQWTE